MNGWDSLHGLHTLECIRTDVRHPFDESASGIAFELRSATETKTVFVFENPNDGYRSSAAEPMICAEPMYSFGCDPQYIRVPVRVQVMTPLEYHTSASGIELIDTRNDLVILRVGTDNNDDYYPSFAAEWMPQNVAAGA